MTGELIALIFVLSRAVDVGVGDDERGDIVMLDCDEVLEIEVGLLLVELFASLRSVIWYRPIPGGLGWLAPWAHTAFVQLFMYQPNPPLSLEMEGGELVKTRDLPKLENNHGHGKVYLPNVFLSNWFRLTNVKYHI